MSSCAHSNETAHKVSGESQELGEQVSRVNTRGGGRIVWVSSVHAFSVILGLAGCSSAVSGATAEPSSAEDSAETSAQPTELSTDASCRLLLSTSQLSELAGQQTACSAFASDPVEQAWSSRDPLPSCGSVSLGHFDSLERDARGELTCLRSALDSGEGAELRINHITLEGDPVTSFYRVTPGGAFEAYADNTEDPNSDQRWTYFQCNQPHSVPDFTC